MIRGILYALPPSLALWAMLIPPILLLPWWVALGLLPYCLIYARIIASNYRIARGHG